MQLIKCRPVGAWHPWLRLDHSPLRLRPEAARTHKQSPISLRKSSPQRDHQDARKHDIYEFMSLPCRWSFWEVDCACGRSVWCDSWVPKHNLIGHPPHNATFTTPSFFSKSIISRARLKQYLCFLAGSTRRGRPTKGGRVSTPGLSLNRVPAAVSSARSWTLRICPSRAPPPQSLRRACVLSSKKERPSSSGKNVTICQSNTHHFSSFFIIFQWKLRLVMKIMKSIDASKSFLTDLRAFAGSSLRPLGSHRTATSRAAAGCSTPLTRRNRRSSRRCEFWIDCWTFQCRSTFYWFLDGQKWWICAKNDEFGV